MLNSSISFLKRKIVFNVLSAEVLSDQNKVEDTLMTGIYVLPQEMNARIVVEKQKRDTLEVVIENAGPTTLFLGEFYSIELLRDIRGISFHLLIILLLL